MQKINQKYISSVVKKALDEDLKPMGDITTKLIKFSNKKIKARINSLRVRYSLKSFTYGQIKNLL